LREKLRVAKAGKNEHGKKKEDQLLKHRGCRCFYVTNLNLEFEIEIKTSSLGLISYELTSLMIVIKINK
jgi:hypothetical protein